MTVESAGKILVRKILPAVEALYDRITSVYHVTDKKEAALCGSTVMFSIGPDSFLATAKHVIDQSKSSSVYVDAPSNSYTARAHNLRRPFGRLRA
jgi:hypothetical protein